jgi:hypothetical protein
MCLITIEYFLLKFSYSLQLSQVSWRSHIHITVCTGIVCFEVDNLQ